MTDNFFADLPSPAPITLPPPSALPNSYDESLRHSATARWRASSEGLRELFAGVPSVRTSLDLLLKQQLDLDGPAVGLQFSATAEHGERFILLTDALAFVFQHPQLDSTLDAQCRIVGLTASHALFALTPLQLLGRLEALNVESFISERWNAYWEARAPGTPVSRRERASQLHRIHFEATVQRAFAERTLTSEQLKPPLLQMETPAAGMTELLADQQTAQLAVLRNGSAGKPGLADQGARAMVEVDRIDRQRSISPVLSAPPGLEPTPKETAAQDHEEQSLFGSLYADIPWPQRQAASHAQRDRLEALRTETGDLKAIKALQQSLENAEQAADNSASTLLNQEGSLEDIALNKNFIALHKCHKDGLHAEAEIQRVLEQLTEAESSLLKALLDTPGDPGANRIAASLTLSVTDQDGSPPKVNTQELSGPFVMTHADALLDTASPHSILLYWPGTGGGLQRFANRRALERQLLKIDDNASHLTLHLTKISGDPLLYALNQLNSDFEFQAAGIRQRTARPDQQTQQTEQLEALRKRTLAALQVPANAARSLAFAHELEQDRSATLANRLPDVLVKLSANDRGELKALIQAYIVAMQGSHELMTVLLEPRHDFTRRHLQARLRKDFNLKGDFDVHLELPDSVTWEKRYSATPTGKVETSVVVASAQYSKMSLEDLAQFNIDNVHSVQQDAFSQRLVFMRLQVTAAIAQEAITLHNNIKLTYLRKTLPDLDLPKAYEQQIQRAFMGSADESAFINEHRRECLIEPWRLMLRLQGELARLQKQIGLDDLRIFNIAIDANTPDAWRADGKRVVMLPAYLGVGGKDTPNEGGVTLSGVTFIQEQVSGVTLLYTPDSPDDRFLRRYDNLEIARKALFNLCVQDSMVRYVAGRALQGDFRAHVSRIHQAQDKYFDAMIGVGPAWPTTTSLAAHLLNAHCGRLIEAHRGTSRSNDALYMERYALQGPRAFAYIKMATSLLPFIGTAVALYDAWTAANQAVAAFLRGEVGDGVAELGSVLLSLIDAAVDLLPGEAIASALGSGARTLTRTRQLRALSTSAAALQAPSMRQARHVVARFAGYEYEKPLSLTGLQPTSHGAYRNVYRHTDGDFIVRQGRVFQVEWSSDSRNWRLTGNSRKTYKQPIALDENGQWDTWFGVYGATFEGGGLGGGNLLGHMADALDPLWPAAIRERLPRWWVDQAHRRQNALTDAADDLTLKIEAQAKRTEVLREAYQAAPADARADLGTVFEASCLGDIELAKRHFQTLSDLLPLTHGNKRRLLVEFQSNGALLMADRYKHRVFIANHRAHPLMDRVDELTNELDALPKSAFAERLRALENIRKLRLEILKVFDSIDALMLDLNSWYQRISVRADKAKLASEVTLLNGRLSESNMLYLRTGHLLETVTRYDTTDEVSWFILQGQAGAKRSRVDRALFTQFSLPETIATKAERNRILQDCIDQYDEFRRAMNAWTASYPQHFHLDAVPPLLDGIKKMRERARKALDVAPPAPAAGTISKKVFTTENNDLLIGVEHWEPATQQRQYTLTGRDGYKEIWEPATNGRFRLRNPRQQPDTSDRRSLESLLTEARQKLASQEAYQTKVQSYATQGMLPVDLEDMMLKEANELRHRARDIEALSAPEALITQLRDKAGELIATGRALRTRQALQTKKPTDGMLDDLIAQGAVEVRKPGPIKNLGKRRDGRIDHMQEYEVWNLTTAPPEVLWYAHFHYSKAAPRFSEFEKAHLKLPEHRFLTHADNADLPYADIGKRSVVLPHFEKL